jgi:hypothetical protein
MPSEKLQSRRRRIDDGDVKSHFRHLLRDCENTSADRLDHLAERPATLFSGRILNASGAAAAELSNQRNPASSPT